MPPATSSPLPSHAEPPPRVGPPIQHIRVSVPEDRVSHEDEPAVLSEVACSLRRRAVEAVSVDLEHQTLTDQDVDRVAVDHDLLAHADADPAQTGDGDRLEAGVRELGGALADVPRRRAPKGKPLQVSRVNPSRSEGRLPRGRVRGRAAGSRRFARARPRSVRRARTDCGMMAARPSARGHRRRRNARAPWATATWSRASSTVHKPWSRAAVTQATFPLIAAARRSSGRAPGVASQRPDREPLRRQRPPPRSHSE